MGRIRLCALVLASALLAPACGGGSDSAELEALREEVARLETQATTVPPTTTKPAPTTTKPAPTTTKPAPTTTKPAPTTTKPAPTTTKPAPTTTRVIKGTWKTEVKESLMGDPDTSLVWLDAANEITSWLGVDFTPQLVLRCKAGDLDAYVNIRTSHSSVSSGAVSVRVRFDEGETNSLTARVSSDAKAVFLPDSVGIVNQLLDAGEFLIEVAPLQTNKQVVTFFPTGLDFHLPKLTKDCDVPPPYQGVLIPLEESAVDLSHTSYFTEDGSYEVQPLRASCFRKEGDGYQYDLLTGIKVEFEITGHHSTDRIGDTPDLHEDDVRLYTPDGQERKESSAPGVGLEGFDRPYGSGLPDEGETEVFISLFGDGDGTLGRIYGGNLECLAGTYRIVLGYDSGWIGEEIEALLDETFVLGD